jgi:hypothetical protein
MTLGAASEYLVAGYTKMAMLEKLKKAMSEEDMTFAKSLTKSKPALVDWDGYLQFSVLRLGVLDKGLLDVIKKQFASLDHDGDGVLTLEEINRSVEFSRYDIEGRGWLEEKDFDFLWMELVDKLLTVQTAEEHGR